jgi:hypothetical protein
MINVFRGRSKLRPHLVRELYELLPAIKASRERKIHKSMEQEVLCDLRPFRVSLFAEQDKFEFSLWFLCFHLSLRLSHRRSSVLLCAINTKVLPKNSKVCRMRRRESRCCYNPENPARLNRITTERLPAQFILNGLGTQSSSNWITEISSNAISCRSALCR